MRLTCFNSLSSDELNIQLSLGYGIVTSRIEGMTATDPLYAQPTPLEDAVLFDGFVGILGAGRGKSAAWRQCLGDRVLVQADQSHQDISHDEFNVSSVS
jgi:hypothetical protein